MVQGWCRGGAGGAGEVQGRCRGCRDGAGYLQHLHLSKHNIRCREVQEVQAHLRKIEIANTCAIQVYYFSVFQNIEKMKGKYLD